MTQAETAARTDPAGEVAYAWRNIRKTAAGAIEIGDEFRAELRKKYTDIQINRGLERAPGSLARSGAVADLTTSRGLLRLRDVIRNACNWAQENDDRAAKKQPNTSKGVF